MILVFDLDDTLYDEITFVKSGFREVAAFLYRTYSIPWEQCYEKMIMKLSDGRGNIFDDVLSYYDLYSRKNVAKCVSIYRSHKPIISLLEDANDCLARFQNLPQYIVTDGNKLVQKNKIMALGLHNRVLKYYITHRYGIGNSKPSPHCFLKICKKEKVQPPKVVYIADNPIKDFVGIKPLGFKTIRVLRGNYKKLRMEREFEADYEIKSLDEITIDFLHML